MKPTFDSTVDVLVKAYLNDTLEHGTCSACAVGNIIAHHQGVKVRRRGHGFLAWMRIDPLWGRVFQTDSSTRCQKMNAFAYHGAAKDQIDSTGYTVSELASIEYAFETAKRGRCDDEWMFNGLMAVVEVLADIHGISLEKKQEAKAMFVKV